jgi:ABC-2 type transport system permease protein
MSAIFRRELQSYFKGPLGYIYLAIIFFFGGMYLQYQVGSVQTNEISTIFSNMFSIVLFTTPLLTMRLMSEDNRQKTDQALLTAPVSLGGIIWGKFLAAFMLFFIGICSTFVYFIVLSAMSSPDWTMFAGNFVGMLLLGAALIAIGLFLSAMTESQMIAAISAFAVMFLVMMLDSIAAILPTQLSFLSAAIAALSFMTPYNDFTSGILDASNIVYFISVTVVFNYFAIRVLEKKRWS